jgi:hypothetical protein
MTSAGQQPTATLTDKLRVPPATTDDFDARTELSELPGAVGLAGKDCGGTVDFLGPDRMLPGSLRLGGAPRARRLRNLLPPLTSGRSSVIGGQDIAMDLRAAPTARTCSMSTNGSCSTAAHSMTPRVDDALATARSIRQMISDGRSR